MLSLTRILGLLDHIEELLAEERVKPEGERNGNEILALVIDKGSVLRELYERGVEV